MSNDNYFMIHCHTDFSNATTTMDSVTKVQHYIDRAKELGMKGMTFTEHGNVLSWVNKKQSVEKAGMKYVHGVEAYVTETLEDRIRDNYHVVLLAKNYEGVKEINYLMSEKVANNREDGHFYYNPRITFDELMNTSDNILMTTACLGNILNNGSIELQRKYIKFMTENKHRCFLEIQHHNVEDQINYNKKLFEISKRTGVRLIAGTDTHSLNEEYAKGREVLQKSKFIHFDNEDGWDLTFKSIDELIESYEEQGSLPEDVYIEAINNTNVLLDMVEEFELDKSYKYPQLHDDSESVLKKKVAQGLVEKGVNLNEEIKDRINHEIDVMRDNGAIDYMLLEEDYKRWARDNGIIYGSGRGCFTKDSLIVTNETLKTIDKISVGDKVLTADGEFNKVLETFEYDVDENMIEFEYFIQGSSYNKYKNICTTDHKILVNRDGVIDYIPAKDLNVGDLLCSPKIESSEHEDIMFDLADYITSDYEYDDEYIYEVINTNKRYKYSPKWFKRNGVDLTHSWLKRFAYTDGVINRERGFRNKKLFFDNSPFETREDYQKYCMGKSKIIKKIPRYIKLDYMWNAFIGLMYGDGWVRGSEINNTEIGLAINNTTKSAFNRRVFEQVAKRLNLEVSGNKAKGKDLVQLYIYSETIANWIRSEYFVSKRGRDKQFDSHLLEQNKDNLKWLYKGLLKSDGSVREDSNKLDFDNTSLSIVNAFRILNNKLGYEPMALDYRASHTDDRGFISSDSFKVRRPIERQRGTIEEDSNYWFLPITKLKKHKSMKTKVYDMHVENNRSYVINNVVVHNSVTGSFLAYLLGVTGMDSIKHDLNFERFMNSERVSLCD